MGDLGIVALVFFVVPGFVADAVYRAARGAATEKGDLRTLLRSLAWSTVGLLGALLAFPGIVAIQEVADQLVSGNYNKVEALPIGAFWQTVVAVVTAAVVGRVATSDRFVVWFYTLFEQSPDAGGAWRAIARVREGRTAMVRTKSGKRYWGKIFAMGDVPKNDLAIVNPIEDLSENGTRTQTLPHTKFIYVREDEIAEMWLSRTELEVKNDG